MSNKYVGYGLDHWAVRSYYEKTGEFRPPKKGEIYLSGAIPEAYKAPNDLNTSFHILRKVADPKREIIVDGFRYVLNGAATS